MKDREEVFAHNASALARMDSEAAGILQQLVTELARRGTLISLSDPENLSVSYKVEAGDPSLVTTLARLLRLAHADESKLVAYNPPT